MKNDKEQPDITNRPEWIAGTKFLDDCMVKDDDERFLRFYDFIAGWSACKKETHSYTEPDLEAAFEAGVNYNNDCHCGKCGYCLDVKTEDEPNFKTWVNNYSKITPTYTQEQMIAFGERVKMECLDTIRSQDDGYDNKKKVSLIDISKLLNK